MIGRGAIIVSGVLLLQSCIIPMTETHRPPVTGRVTHHGRPVEGVQVEACTWSTWLPFTCQHSARDTTNARGEYALPPHTNFPTIIMGEAPLMETIVTVCSPNGQAYALIGSEAEPVAVDLALGEPLRAAANPFRTTERDATEAAKLRCQQRPGGGAP